MTEILYHGCPKEDTESILQDGLLRAKSSLWKASGGAIYLNRGNCWMNKSSEHDILRVSLPQSFVDAVEVWDKGWQVVFWSDIPPRHITVFRRWRSRTWWHRFCCWVGWHSWPSFEQRAFDGRSVHARCRWCGYEGLIDSQGNLF